MNETPALPPPEPEPEPSPATPATHRRDLLPWLSALGFVVLAAAIGWLWTNPPAADTAALDGLKQDIAALNARLTELEHRPPPNPPDLAPLAARVTALEQRQPPDLQPLEKRVAALEHREPSGAETATHADVQTLSARLDAIAARQDQLANRQQGLETGIGSRLDDADRRLQTLERQATGAAALTSRLDQIDQRLGSVEQSQGRLSALAERAGRLARIEAAQAALDAGQPLGDIPGAPPAVTRFASTKPPTEAGLRLAFPQAARAAVSASRPSLDGKAWYDRLWARAQDLITVREGEHVIVGEPAAGILASARQALDAGDLAGAVADLSRLSGPPAQAIAAWLADARALLEARTALGSMAAHA
jgi:hypothetical protein